MIFDSHQKKKVATCFSNTLKSKKNTTQTKDSIKFSADYSLKPKVSQESNFSYTTPYITERQYCIGKLAGIYSNRLLKTPVGEYPAKLNFKVQEWLKTCIKCPFKETQVFTVVPHTHKVRPYISFTITGINTQQTLLDSEGNYLNYFEVFGKVIYENIKHEFILVKITRKHETETVSKILKFHGVLNSNREAVDRFWKIEANTQQDKLFIKSATLLPDSEPPYTSKNKVQRTKQWSNYSPIKDLEKANAT